MLRRLFDFSPWFDVYIQEPDDGNGSLKRIKRFPAYRFSNRAVWAIWRRLPGRLRPGPPIEFNVWMADLLLANWIVPSTIFHGRTASCLASLRVAKQQGAIALVETASRHPRHWKETEIEECRHFGVHSRDGSGNSTEFMLRRRDREFERSDHIVVPSTVARQSFAEMGYGEKTEVVLPGVDSDFFVPHSEVSKRETEPSSVFRVCYVGRVELAKGIGYLLQAWKRLALSGAELVLVGQVNPQMKSLLGTYADSSVRLMGFMPPGSLARRYHESNLFVLPSPNEGFGMVLLEAMASGVPAIGTDMTGAVDCIENGRDGVIVPARDVDALADAILWCYQHRHDLPVMGRAARARIESNFTLEHYNQRMIELYRRLAGRSPI
jgi:alpha-maltose-1-phosphate synthase